MYPEEFIEEAINDAMESSWAAVIQNT